MLDHAITVRDLLYVFVGSIGLIIVAGCAGALYLHRLDKKRDRKRDVMRRELDDHYAKNPIKRAEPTSYDRNGQPRYHIRNPAYGVPDDVKWQDGRPYTTD
jgi:hypothetical protein